MIQWDYQIEDENYQKDPWIVKKGKEYITYEKDNLISHAKLTTIAIKKNKK